MNNLENNRIPEDKDRQLDIPAESNSGKHINFLDTEDTGDSNHQKDKKTADRQKEWKEGLEEGKKLNENY